MTYKGILIKLPNKKNIGLVLILYTTLKLMNIRHWGIKTLSS